MEDNEKLFLKYADLINLVNATNEDLSKLCMKNRLTAGRDFRRQLREMKTTIVDMIRLSSTIEKELRAKKEENKKWM